jgi:hypothetical protein
MSWFNIAANLLRDALSSSSEPSPPAPEEPPPANIAEVTELLNRHRFEIDKNFEAVAAMLEAQKKRHLQAMQIQRRWNYGLTVALSIGAILAIVAYWRHSG